MPKFKEPKLSKASGFQSILTFISLYLNLDIFAHLLICFKVIGRLSSPIKMTVYFTITRL